MSRFPGTGWRFLYIASVQPVNLSCCRIFFFRNGCRQRLMVLSFRHGVMHAGLPSRFRINILSSLNVSLSGRQGGQPQVQQPHVIFVNLSGYGPFSKMRTLGGKLSYAMRRSHDKMPFTLQKLDDFVCVIRPRPPYLSGKKGLHLFGVAIGTAAMGNTHPLRFTEIIFQTVPAAFAFHSLPNVPNPPAVRAHRQKIFI